MVRKVVKAKQHYSYLSLIMTALAAISAIQVFRKTPARKKRGLMSKIGNAAAMTVAAGQAIAPYSRPRSRFATWFAR